MSGPKLGRDWEERNPETAAVVVVVVVIIITIIIIIMRMMMMMCINSSMIIMIAIIMNVLSLLSFWASCTLQDSSKGGAVETGCSDLYEVMYVYTTLLCNTSL